MNPLLANYFIETYLGGQITAADFERLLRGEAVHDRVALERVLHVVPTELADYAGEFRRQYVTPPTVSAQLFAPDASGYKLHLVPSMDFWGDSAASLELKAGPVVDALEQVSQDNADRFPAAGSKALFLRYQAARLANTIAWAYFQRETDLQLRIIEASLAHQEADETVWFKKLAANSSSIYYRDRANHSLADLSGWKGKPHIQRPLAALAYAWHYYLEGDQAKAKRALQHYLAYPAQVIGAPKILFELLLIDNALSQSTDAETMQALLVRKNELLGELLHTQMSGSGMIAVAAWWDDVVHLLAMIGMDVDATLKRLKNLQTTGEEVDTRADTVELVPVPQVVIEEAPTSSLKEILGQEANKAILRGARYDFLGAMSNLRFAQTEEHDEATRKQLVGYYHLILLIDHLLMEKTDVVLDLKLTATFLEDGMTLPYASDFYDLLGQIKNLTHPLTWKMIERIIVKTRESFAHWTDQHYPANPSDPSIGWLTTKRIIKLNKFLEKLLDDSLSRQALLETIESTITGIKVFIRIHDLWHPRWVASEDDSTSFAFLMMSHVLLNCLEFMQNKLNPPHKPGGGNGGGGSKVYRRSHLHLVKGDDGVTGDGGLVAKGEVLVAGDGGLVTGVVETEEAEMQRSNEWRRGQWSSDHEPAGAQFMAFGPALLSGGATFVAHSPMRAVLTRS